MGFIASPQFRLHGMIDEEGLLWGVKPDSLGGGRGKGQAEEADRGTVIVMEAVGPGVWTYRHRPATPGLLKMAEPPATYWARRRAAPETSLNLRYVLCLEALRSLFDLELHKLAFVQ
jgi:hypothetical protein